MGRLVCLYVSRSYTFIYEFFNLIFILFLGIKKLYLVLSLDLFIGLTNNILFLEQIQTSTGKVEPFKDHS